MVTNPYANPKKLVSTNTDITGTRSTGASTSTAIGHHGEGVTEGGGGGRSRRRERGAFPVVDAVSFQPPPPPPPITVELPKYTTFSQAFVDDHNTNHHDDESDERIPMTHQHNHHTITSNTATSIPPIEADITACVDPNNTNQTTTATIASTATTTTTTAFASDRDYHVLQQQPHVLYVSTKQHGNPILSYIRNVPFTYTRMVPDYIFSNTSCAIYLSCKYHILYRNYIHSRIAALKTDFTCRILLLYVDMEDVDKVLHEINLLCVTHNFTLILGWSEMEMARYIETFKVLQNRDASSIQKSKDSQMHHMSMVDQMVDVLLSTSKKGTKLNKTDAATLLTHFTSMQQIIQATPDELSLIPGLGPTKVQRLHDTFHLPFSTKLSRERQKRLQNKESTIDEVDDPIATASNTTTSKS